MKYTVTADSEMVETGLSKKEAIKLANESIVKYPDDEIHVEFYRSSDGQHGYLNQGGNHEITGKAWV